MSDFFKKYQALLFALLTFFLLHSPHEAQAQQQTQAHKFYMGFTPWPYDLTDEALRETYGFINQNATIIAHHFDGGVPWEAALHKRPLPAHLLKDWEHRKKATRHGMKIFLSVTPLNFGRDGLALAWTDDGDNQPLPEMWQAKAFDDPAVVQAYTNYVQAAVRFFAPDFLAIGIESNIMISKAPEKWPAYLALNKAVYQAVKQSHPDLPVFATVQYEHLRGIEDEAKPNHGLQHDAVAALMKHADALALSTYKYGMLHPNKISADYFDEALSFKKPLAIAESGAMSETTVVVGIPLPSNKKTQTNFTAMILEQAAAHDFLFVINWVAIDFDAMIAKLPKSVRGIAKAWVHTGLLTKKKKPKPAFEVWKLYLSKQR
ncbi:MAG: hypothetical protein EP349_06625 [Alphaproteobacteria bacterium]|nr:MAG: hypothetical protein EP349_06625 [Alphaproteobacteria bacterium]